MSTTPCFLWGTDRYRQIKPSQRVNYTSALASATSLNTSGVGGDFFFFLKKQMISLFICRTRVHPPTSHYHQDLSHYNLYLCSQMEDSVQELASCVCNYAQVRGCMAVCLGLGFEGRKEGRKKRRWGLTGWRWGGPREQGEKRKKQWS